MPFSKRNQDLLTYHPIHLRWYHLDWPWRAQNERNASFLLLSSQTQDYPAVCDSGVRTEGISCIIRRGRIEGEREREGGREGRGERERNTVPYCFWKERLFQCQPLLHLLWTKELQQEAHQNCIILYNGWWVIDNYEFIIIIQSRAYLSPLRSTASREKPKYSPIWVPLRGWETTLRLLLFVTICTCNANHVVTLLAIQTN